uniref:Uncharacterized protein n=1 Tax=Caenorhabditis japonica TaxID=281687 RepID=A0A8R1HNV8_CAEJA
MSHQNEKTASTRKKDQNGEDTLENSPGRMVPRLNCCEDNMENGEIQEPPQEFPSKDSMNRCEGSGYHNRKSRLMEIMKREMKKNEAEKVPVKHRNIENRKSKNSLNHNSPKLKTRSNEDSSSKQVNESWKPVEETEISKYLANNVPYIDSHCHTDFMYTYMAPRSAKNHEGVNNWAKQCPDGFPKSFSGFIANFIDPRLFVWTKESEGSYDLDWVERELHDSGWYLGTTWGCHPHHAQR